MEREQALEHMRNLGIKFLKRADEGYQEDVMRFHSLIELMVNWVQYEMNRRGQANPADGDMLREAAEEWLIG